MGIWGIDIGSGGGGGGSSKTPDQVTGLWGWWKADAGTSTTTDGVGVSQWNDQSGNARNLVQATGGNQPVFKTAIVNGKPVLRFTSGSSQWMSLGAAGPGQANPSDLSIFVVAKLSIGGNKTPVSTRDTGSLGWIFRLTASGSLFGHLGGSNITDTFTPTNWNIAEIVRTALSGVLGHNGTMAGAASVTAYPPASTRFDVGAEVNAAGPSATNFFDGDIAEIAVYSAAVSDADRDALEVGFGAKYAITVV